VNLDSWTKAQVDVSTFGLSIALKIFLPVLSFPGRCFTTVENFIFLFQYMEEWGNGRANVYYEANVPAHVVKPKEGDSVRVVEKYIREKYEHKKYIAKSVPPKNDRSENVEEDDSAHSNRSSKSASGVPAQVITRQRPAATSASSSRKEPAVPVQPPAPAPSLIDFMDMDTSTVTQAPLIPSNASVASQQPDLFGAFTPSTPAPSAPVAATSPFGDFVTAAPAAGGAHATSFGSDQVRTVPYNVQSMVTVSIMKFYT
jgi:hypothetical protein